MDYQTKDFFRTVGAITFVAALIVAFFLTLAVLYKYANRDKYEYCIEQTGYKEYCWNRYYLEQYDKPLPEGK